MTQRETKEIEILGHKIISNIYITGKEAREIEAKLLDDIEFKQVGKGAQMSGVKASSLIARGDLQIKSVIVSIDGVTGSGVLEYILNLPAEHTEAIMEHVRTIAEPKKAQAGN